MSDTPTVTVLAGTNGAGKSSLIGELIRSRGGEYYNPDEIARELRERHPQLDRSTANGLAWTLGREALETAIAERRDYVFETTLGGSTMAGLLRTAAERGIRVKIWYIGLRSADEHVCRVKARARRGGHDIEERTIRARYTRSLENLVALLPALHELRVFDNSEPAEIAAGERPRPRVLLHFKKARIVELADPRTMPDWAKPIAAAAMRAADSVREARLWRLGS